MRAMRVVGDLADGGELKSTSKEAHHLGEPLTTKTIFSGFICTTSSLQR
ncbi:hypothetical protein HMPREF1577_00831 [Gardnerella pickettii JCP8017A]|uniref:Uncharacterized protein n=1 Tax=Gardnerella pickettii JCP8017A TaxID=1261062 RepID=T2PKI9_9BIFI|nr:hypothetical protein HMPREF1577_00831 [Gardnerella pickettii JCP8017A]EPI62189.1 hypothetical protein HMPREF1578_00228 [Gardnerella pickettii JCP8017B]